LAFPIHEFWADIGLKKDYLKLNNNEWSGNNYCKKKFQKIKK
jgi:NDP-sugar pyrophosphorylase family protein